MAGESVRHVAQRRRAKAARLQRSADLYDQVAQGERLTAEALDALPREKWTVLHDLRWPGRVYSNVDHVVFGPPGIFVINSKTWAGAIQVTGHRLRENGRSRARVVASSVQAAWAVASLVPSVPPRLVHSVICFARDERLAGLVGDVLVCSTANLVEMLESRVHEMSREQLRVVPGQLLDHLAAVELSGAPARVRPPRPRRTRKTHEPKTPAWRRRGPGHPLVAPTVATLCAVLVFITVPGAVAEAAQSFGHLIAGHFPG